MTLLPPSNLETMDYGYPAWNFIFNKNFELLAKALLKLNALQDIASSTPSDGAVLVWNGATSKWDFKYWA